MAAMETGDGAGRREVAPPYVDEVAKGVFAYVQPDGGWCLNNAGMILSAGEALVVDTAATVERTVALRDAIRALTPAVPRVVVNTHSHGDHTFGNCVFAPGAVVVAHRRARAEMVAAGLHLTGLWPGVRWGGISVTPPRMTFEETLTLHVGEVRVELLYVGPAHTTGDIVAWLPDQRVLFAGDLVMAGVTPFCMMGSIAGSLRAMARLHALGARSVVPGHGPVGGPELLAATEAYLLRVRALAREGIAAGLSPLGAAREAALGEYATLLDAERLVPNLHRAYAEERGAAPGEPLDVGALFGEMADFHGGLPACYA